MTAILYSNTTSPSRNAARDRRRHKRIPLALNGRYLNEKSEDHAMLTRDISCSGAFIVSAQHPPVGARIVCYFDELGRVACDVLWRSERGFAVSFSVTDHKRDKIADRLTWLFNRDKLGLTEDRQTPRYAANGPALITRANGLQMQCRAIDISLTGASFEARGVAPHIGEIVTAGSIRGEVVRCEGAKFAIRYLLGDESKSHPPLRT